MSDESRRAPAATPELRTAVTPTRVAGVTLHRMVRVEDGRGILCAADFGVHVPFTPSRYFVIFDVASSQIRGKHAHRKCHQFLVCVRGSVAVAVDDGRATDEILLDAADLGLHVPPMVWAIQYRYSSDALLLVFASDPYDPDDYIRHYEEFRAIVS
jgi:dTDP-4-dehydrorhamnose 3,5-epimerase-like enzyme